jgi:hypothetical protein
MLDAGDWMLDARYWMLDTGCWILDAGCWMLDTGCWILDTGCSMLGTGCGVLDEGCWMRGAGCLVLDAWCWMLGAGCLVLDKNDVEYKAEGIRNEAHGSRPTAFGKSQEDVKDLRSEGGKKQKLGSWEGEKVGTDKWSATLDERFT